MTSTILNSNHTDSFGNHGRTLEKEELLIKELIEIMTIDPAEGRLWWKVSTGPRVQAGDEADVLPERAIMLWDIKETI